MDIFVGSLPFKLKENELKEIFEKYGEVTSVKIIIDKITRQNKGFGFVEMPVDEQAKQAIQELNGSDIGGRAIIVNKSEEKKDMPRASSSGRNNNQGGFNKGFNRKGSNKKM